MPSSAHTTQTWKHTRPQKRRDINTHAVTQIAALTRSQACASALTRTCGHDCCCEGTLLVMFLVSLSCRLRTAKLSYLFVLFCGGPDTRILSKNKNKPPVINQRHGCQRAYAGSAITAVANNIAVVYL